MLSTFMLSFIFVIICGLFEWKLICVCFSSLVYIAVQLSRGKGCYPINQFKPTTCVCLSQARTWISNVICKYFVNVGHAIIHYLLKLVGGKALGDKIEHVTYMIKMRLVMNSIMYYSAHLFTTIDDVYWILPI